MNLGKLSVNTCGVHVRLPSDHLSQIGLTEQKDQTNHSVWVGLTNSVKITLHKQNSIFLSECNAILVKVKSSQQKSNASIAGLGKVKYLMAICHKLFLSHSGIYAKFPSGLHTMQGAFRTKAVHVCHC